MQADMYWTCIILRRERAETPNEVTGATVHFRADGPESVDCCENRANAINWVPALMARDDDQTASAVVQRAMIEGDRSDADLMHTFEENNDKMRAPYTRCAQLRRAFIGCTSEDMRAANVVFALLHIPSGRICDVDGKVCYVTFDTEEQAREYITAALASWSHNYAPCLLPANLVDYRIVARSNVPQNTAQGLLTADAPAAREVWQRARAALGSNLDGGSLIDLLADNFPSWPLDYCRAMAAHLKETDAPGLHDDRRAPPLGCGCCNGPESDRCTCHMHQDISRGLRAKVCTYHRENR